MAERERALTPPRGGVVVGAGSPSPGADFVPRATVLDAEGVRRAITRIAHEILERNAGAADLAVVGLQTGGAPLARRLVDELERIEGQRPPMGLLDVAFYRDDIGLRPVLPEAVTDIPFDLTGHTVVLVDDVLYTGRTVRAALNALGDYGRTKAVQLAVMVDRGHRELPIRPDYVGKNLPTKKTELVDVTDDGVLIGELR